MKKIIVGMVLLLSISGCAQKDMNHDSTYLWDKSKPVIETFFKELQSGKYKTALNNLLSQNQNIDLQDSVTINLKNKFNDINESSGRFMAYKFLRKKELANDLGVYVYLVKYESKFYRFTFTFYNNGSNAKIYKFSFDDSIDIELEESIKLYMN